jgi:hypothetical protein
LKTLWRNNTLSPSRVSKARHLLLLNVAIPKRDKIIVKLPNKNIFSKCSASEAQQGEN